MRGALDVVGPDSLVDSFCQQKPIDAKGLPGLVVRAVIFDAHVFPRCLLPLQPLPIVGVNRYRDVVRLVKTDDNHLALFSIDGSVW